LLYCFKSPAATVVVTG